MLQVFMCSDFVGHYPVGTAAELTGEETLDELALNEPCVVILDDGDY